MVPREVAIKTSPFDWLIAMSRMLFEGRGLFSVEN